MPTVSVGCLKYSPFWETATGDWVRSVLRGRGSIVRRAGEWRNCRRGRQRKLWWFERGAPIVRKACARKMVRKCRVHFSAQIVFPP
jgi:hypothetical protein